MSPVFTRLLFIVTLLIQAPANPAADKGVITGRLLTVDGTPAVAVRVMAMAVTEPAPAAAAGGAVAIVSLSETDSAGRYRLENIPPGKYYVTAGLTDLPTFYPGGMAVSAATVITVTPGSITNGIDFSMRRGTGVKVTGRLAILPTLQPSTPSRASLLGTLPPPIETTINEDGTFAFQLVRPGTYALRTSIGLTTAVVVNDRDVNVVVGTDLKGVRVIGKAIVSSAPGAPVFAQNINLSSNGQGFSTSINSDGSFEFLRVPPGTYTVRSAPSFAPPPTINMLVVADKDITNLEVPVPFLALVSGTVTVEEGTAVPQLRIQARGSNDTSSTVMVTSSAGPSGPFTLRLSEGSHQISVSNLPLGYVVKSITEGDLDLTKSSLDFGPGKPIADIRIVVGKNPVESIAGVKVSGKVSGLTGDRLSTARVTLSLADRGGPTIETTLNADGTFFFSNVPTGRYDARLTGTPQFTVTPPSLQFVLEEPMSGLQFQVNPTSQIRGLISAVDANGVAIAELPANISIQFRRDNNSGSGTLSKPDGTFGLPLAEGEYTVTVNRMPAGYTVKSILSGSTDITRAPLSITGSQRITDIQIVLESR